MVVIGLVVLTPAQPGSLWPSVLLGVTEEHLALMVAVGYLAASNIVIPPFWVGVGMRCGFWSK